MAVVAFSASFLQEVMNHPKFQLCPVATQQQVKHLQFLLQLVSSHSEEVLEELLQEHRRLKEEIESGTTSWDDVEYFQSWEQKLFLRFNKKDGDDYYNYNDLDVKLEEEDSDYENNEVLDDEDFTNDSNQIKEEATSLSKVSFKRSDPDFKEHIQDTESFNSDQQQNSECKDCGKEFETMKKKLHHLRKIHKKWGGISYSEYCDTCSLCGLTFGKRERRLFWKHLFDEHNEHTCRCGHGVADFQKLLSHMKNCDLKFRKTGKFIKGSTDMFECDQCDFKTRKPYIKIIKRHNFTQHGETSCLCGKSFDADDFDGYFAHCQDISCAFHIKLKCGVSGCEEEFSTHEKKIYHMKKVHNCYGGIRYKTKEGVPYWKPSGVGKGGGQERGKKEMCPFCGEWKTDLAQHITRAHDERRKEEKEKCHICGKMVFNLKTHMDWNHAEAGLEEKCPYCDMRGPKNKVRHHIKTRHDEGSHGNCPWCGTFTKSLKRHLQYAQCNIPENERIGLEKQVCEVCNKELKNKMMLQRHMNAAHGSGQVKNHFCDQCDYKSNSKHNLKLHIRRVHEGNYRKEECPYCCKSVFTLQWHIETYHAVEMAKMQSLPNPTHDGIN